MTPKDFRVRLGRMENPGEAKGDSLYQPLLKCTAEATSPRSRPLAKRVVSLELPRPTEATSTFLTGNGGHSGETVSDSEHPHTWTQPASAAASLLTMYEWLQ